MPIYYFEHPKTKEVFEEIRSFSQADDPFIAPDGQECKKVPWYTTQEGRANTKRVGKMGKGLYDKNAEVWEIDPGYVKSLNPKRVRTRSGKSIPYNPNTMS